MKRVERGTLCFHLVMGIPCLVLDNDPDGNSCLVMYSDGSFSIAWTDRLRFVA
jgi:hypothetical protein